MKLPESPACVRTIGIMLGIVSSLFFATGMLCFKLIHDINSAQIVFFRVCFAASLTGSYAAMNREPLFMLRNPYVWLISIFCIFTNYFFFFGLKILSIGDVSAIFSAQPIIVGILAYIFLKEHFDIVDAMLTFVIIIGVFLVVHPSFIFHQPKTPATHSVSAKSNASNHSADRIDSDLNLTAELKVGGEIDNVTFRKGLKNLNLKNPSSNGTCQWSHGDQAIQQGVFQLSRYWACSLVFLAAIASAVIFFLNGKSTEVFQATIMTHSNFVVLLGGLLIITALGGWSFPRKVAPWSWIGAMALSMIGAQICEIMAARYETATVLAIIKVFQIPFCFVFDMLFLRDFPQLFDAIGALLVTVVVLVFAVKRYIREKNSPDEDDTEMQTIIAK